MASSQVPLKLQSATWYQNYKDSLRGKNYTGVLARPGLRIDLQHYSLLEASITDEAIAAGIEISSSFQSKAAKAALHGLLPTLYAKHKDLYGWDEIENIAPGWVIGTLYQFALRISSGARR